MEEYEGVSYIRRLEGTLLDTPVKRQTKKSAFI